MGHTVRKAMNKTQRNCTNCFRSGAGFSTESRLSGQYRHPQAVDTTCDFDIKTGSCQLLPVVSGALLSFNDGQGIHFPHAPVAATPKGPLIPLSRSEQIRASRLKHTCMMNSHLDFYTPSSQEACAGGNNAAAVYGVERLRLQTSP